MCCTSHDAQKMPVYYFLLMYCDCSKNKFLDVLNAKLAKLVVHTHADREMAGSIVSWRSEYFLSDLEMNEDCWILPQYHDHPTLTSSYTNIILPYLLTLINTLISKSPSAPQFTSSIGWQAIEHRSVDQSSIQESAHHTSHDGLENDAMCCTLQVGGGQDGLIPDLQPVPEPKWKCCFKCKMKCSHLKLTQKRL